MLKSNSYFEYKIGKMRRKKQDEILVSTFTVRDDRDGMQ